jgi:predicted DNA-binding mobile mystery protein A
MARGDSRTLARLRLDQHLNRWRDLPVGPPVRGWIRAIREALGMSTTDLALRLGSSRQAVSAMERSEQSGAIRLETLRRAAAAMDCTLVYTLVPNDSLEHIVDRRARTLAIHDLGRVRHTMLLEDQLDDDADADDRLVDELADEIKRSPRLWRS